MKFLLVSLSAAVLFSCSKKGSGFNDSSAFNANVEAQTNDQVRISTTIDAIFNDVDSVLANPVNLCAANVTVDSVDSPRVISIAYNGSACGFLLYHQGTVRIFYAVGNNWNATLDTVLVTFTNVVVNTPPDTTNLLFNGGFYYTNVSGGSLSDLAGGGASAIVHSITGVNLNIIYHYTWPSNWQIARRRTYTNDGSLVISTTGMDSVGGYANVSEWGGNRFGNSVIAAVDSPLTITQACGWRQTSGQIQLYNPVGMTNMTYGLDSTGVPTSCPLTGVPYYYKLSWTGSGQNPYTRVLPYP
jgi:hypothetical protein